MKAEEQKTEITVVKVNSPERQQKVIARPVAVNATNVMTLTEGLTAIQQRKEEIIFRLRNKVRRLMTTNK
jgi:hypothetical protein